MEVIDLPDANLAEAIAEAESRDADHDDARAPRKRRATTHDDSDTHSSTSDSARPRKKAPRASRAAAAAAGRAGASATKAPHPTRTQQPTATVAAPRQPDEDGFVAPPRRHTAKAAALQPPQPLPTTNAFAGADADEMEDDEAPLVPPQRKPPPPPPIVVQWDGEYKNFEQKIGRGCTAFQRGRNQQRGRGAPSRKVHPTTSFAAATKSGLQRSDLHDREIQQPSAPSTAPPERAVAAPDARVTRSRTRRRRGGRATRAAAQQTATDTPPQQQQSTRAAPRLRPDTDASRQSTPPESPQSTAPVAESDRSSAASVAMGAVGAAGAASATGAAGGGRSILGDCRGASAAGRGAARGAVLCGGRVSSTVRRAAAGVARPARRRRLRGAAARAPCVVAGAATPTGEAVDGAVGGRVSRSTCAELRVAEAGPPLVAAAKLVDGCTLREGAVPPLH
ncbi:serine/arginine repetitive matrix protein 1-like [Schistocerca americana]|uniref:serine/arginine repetitive matrix protein 1-like n=1 Tax=Schistocerca americana TaxID=7009 RepID=UPI001F4F5E45|nr:serine/arginine repetitive matrix protein 1-like [Schistocerca americana]